MHWSLLANSMHATYRLFFDKGVPERIEDYDF
jgi:hypothetical protein